MPLAGVCVRSALTSRTLFPQEWRPSCQSSSTTPPRRFTSSSSCGWPTSTMPSAATPTRARGIGSGESCLGLFSATHSHCVSRLLPSFPALLAEAFAPELLFGSLGEKLNLSYPLLHQDIYYLSLQVLLPVPLCLLCLPLPLQRAVQQPGARHVLALHPGEQLPPLPHVGATGRLEAGTTRGIQPWPLHALPVIQTVTLLITHAGCAVKN